MNEALKIVLSLSLSGSLLILILYLIRPLVKERLSKRWQYYIWLVVIARLLLPFAPEINLMGTFFQEINKGMEQIEFITPSNQGAPLVSESGIQPPGNMENGQDTFENGQPASSASADNPARNILPVILQNLWLVWLVVALILFIRKITIYQDFVKYIRAGCVEVADIDMLERFGKLVEQNKVKTIVGLYTNNLISSPLLIGFFRPCIVLPSADLPPADFQYTILHELAHYKRRDMFYKWLVQLAVCVHWFNPLVYVMSRDVGRACELSCDEAVIWTLDPQERRAYGDTLLNAMGAGGNYKDSLAAVTLNESKELLKERLDSIMRFKKKSGIVITITFALTLLFATGATTIGVYAGPKNSADNNTDNISSGITAENDNPVTAQPVTDGPDSTKVNGPYLTVESCTIQYEDTPYKWPFILSSVTNNSDKSISSCEIGLLAYDKEGKPLELYWDARNVDKSGSHGNVGFSPDGIDYGIVTGIKPYSPKSYYWSIDGCYESIAPGEKSETDGWHLFDGWWDQPNHIHKVSYFLTCVKQITFEDGMVWDNPEYDGWLTTYQGIQVAPDILKSYYK